MSFSKIFIDRPIATSLVMAAIFLAGLLGFTQLPIAPLPRVDFPTVSVNASLPGADPETMASSVATPLERQFAQIPDLTQMTSTSTLGQTSITLQFDLDRNADAAAQDVSAAINAAGGQLPKNFPNPPTYRKVNPADSPIMMLGVWSETLPLDQVDDNADNILSQQLSQISGVGQVFIFGERKPAVRIEVNPGAASNAGVSLEDVRTALVRTSLNSPKGIFSGTHQTSAIATNDQIMKGADYRRVIVAYRNGAPVHISDIGDAFDGAENTQIFGWADKHPGVLIGVFRQPGSNIIGTVDRVKAALPQLQLQLPRSVHVDTLVDRTTSIRASVNDVESTLLVTICLVVMVIFIFLRKVWATVIPAISVPLSLVGAFGVMHLLGYSLDNLSLMALTVAVGFVVDDAIVMIENIVRHMENGENAYEAAVKGAKEIGFTIISITFSLMAVFIPILLMGGLVGRLFREFAMTLGIAVLISSFVSLTLTPTMCALFLGKHEEHHGRFYERAEQFFTWLSDSYARLLRIVLRHQRLTAISLLVTIVFTLALAIFIPKGFFPQQDTGLLNVATEAAQDVSYDVMMKKQEQANAIMRADPDMGPVPSFIGPENGNTTNTGRMFPGLKPFSQRSASADEVINRLRPKLAQIPGFNVYMQSRQDITIGGRPSRTQYQYTLQGNDLTELNHWSGVMLDRLKAMPLIQDVATDQQSGGLRTMVKIDREIASRMGVTPQQIDDTLYDAFGQRQVATIFTQLNQYHVILEIDPRFSLGPEALQTLYVKSDDGTLVPLSSMASTEATTTPLSISHQGQFPAITLSFNLAPHVALGDAIAAIRDAEKESRLPATIIPTFQGTAQAFQASLVTMPYLIIAALVSVYIVLGILYESYIHPLTILSTIPSAGAGALLMLRIVGHPLDMMGLIGLILLIGIVKKNAIMMIDFALEAERHQGMSPEDAIYQAALLRFRPIMMTTTSAFTGGLTLMLSNGAGSEFRHPLGIAIVGGLIVSQALTLFTTPVVYLYLDRFGARLRGVRREKRPAAEPIVINDAAE